MGNKKNNFDNKNKTNNKNNQNYNQNNVRNEINNMPPVSMGDIGNKMKKIFGRMNSQGIQYNTYASAIGRTRDKLYNDLFLQNPYAQNERIKKSNTTPILHTKSEIREAFKAPSSNEQAFRETSMALYYSNYVYGNLLRLSRDVPQFFNYVIPKVEDETIFKTEEFKKEKKFVNDILEKFRVAFTFKNISLQVAQEGKCSYVFRSSVDKNKKIVDYALLQKLPPDYIKYTGYGSDSPLIVSFNFLIFLNPQYDIKQWPPWFEEIWDKLQAEGIIDLKKPGFKKVNIENINGSQYSFEGVNGSYYLYVEMPQDLVYTFGSDFSNPLELPEYIGLFEDLSDLDAYKVIQSQSVLTNITSILTAEVPVDKDARGGSDASVLSPEVIMGLEGDCSQAVNSTVYPFFGPLKNFKLHQVDHIPNAMDIVLQNLRNVISTAGVSGLIATTDKPSIAMIKAAEYLFESKMKYFTEQCESFLNIVLNKYFGLQNTYKVVIWGGCYTWREEISPMKELINNGYKGLLPRLLSAYDMTVDDYKNEHCYVDSLDINFNEDKINNLVSTNKKVGRPALDDNEVENENTEASRDGGENDSQNK